jgi:hypothetical protein
VTAGEADGWAGALGDAGGVSRPAIQARICSGVPT